MSVELDGVVSLGVIRDLCNFAHVRVRLVVIGRLL